MKFLAHPVTDLPPLSWLAEVNTKLDQVSLLHGCRVEVCKDFFIEGVWNGPFEFGQFDRTDCIFGSGGVVGTGNIVFVSSTSTTDYLYYREVDGIVIASNSLCFLLAYTGDELDPKFSGYAEICNSIADGIERYQPRIPTKNGSITRLIHRNLSVTRDSAQVVDKPSYRPFENYADYFSFLQVNCRKLMENARDKGRAYPMKLFSTQSKGYDSTAVNALAAKFGIEKVFTVSKSKGRDTFAEKDEDLQEDDDGSEIARQLELQCVPIERRNFENNLDDEYLYFAGIANCEDLNFSGITKHLKQTSILLTGTLGELYYPRKWYTEHYGSGPIGTDLRRGDLGGGHGLTEVRLQKGFLQLPLIYIGARQRESITSITESKEMDPWRLNTDYDRPIPRRIAEEAGVSRESFGQKKLASVIVYARPNIPHGVPVRKEFFSFLVREGLLKPWHLRLFPWVHRYNSLVWFASPHRHRWFYYLSRLTLRIKGKAIALKWRHLDSSLYCFCVNKRAGDYREALKSIQTGKMTGSKPSESNGLHHEVMLKQ
jgi:hypothetical protein